MIISSTCRLTWFSRGIYAYVQNHPFFFFIPTWPMLPTRKESGCWDKRIEAGLPRWAQDTFSYLEYLWRGIIIACVTLWSVSFLRAVTISWLTSLSIEHRSMSDTMVQTSLLFARWINEWVVYSHKHVCATAKMYVCTRVHMYACVWDFVFGLSLDSSMFYLTVLIHSNKFYCECWK